MNALCLNIIRRIETTKIELAVNKFSQMFVIMISS